MPDQQNKKDTAAKTSVATIDLLIDGYTQAGSSVDWYAAQITRLTKAEQELAVARLIAKGANEREIKDAMARAAAGETVTQSMVREALATNENTKAKTSEILVAMGLADAKSTLARSDLEVKLAEALEANGLKATMAKQLANIVATNSATAANEGLSASYKKLGTAMGLAAKSNPIGWAMTAIALIPTLIKLVEEFHKSLDDLIEAGQEAQDALNSTFGELKQNVGTVESIKREYAELAQGIDSISGANKNLSTDDYSRFLDLSNQLAEVFPQLVLRYDENGNAILNLDGNIRTICSSLDELITKERESAAFKASEQLPDIYKGAAAQVEKYRKEISALEDDMLEMPTVIEDGVEKYKTEFRAGLDTEQEKAQELLNKLRVGYGLDYSERVKTTEGAEIIEYLFDTNEFDKAYARYKSHIAKQLSQLENSIKSEYSNFAKYLVTSFAADDDYVKLSDKMQGFADRVISSLDFQKLSGKTLPQIQSFISENIITPLSSGEFNGKAEIALNLLTQLNGDEISISDYSQKISGFIKLLEQLQADGEIDADVVLTFKTIFEDGLPSVGGMAQEVADALYGGKAGDSAIDIASALGGMTQSEFKQFTDWFRELDKSELRAYRSLELLISGFENAREAAKAAGSDFAGLIEAFDSVKDGVSSIAKASEELSEDGSISYGTLSDISEKFADIDGLDDYIKQLAKAAKGSEEFGEIAEDMIVSLVDQKVAAEDMTEANRDYIAAMLKEAGVANADEAAITLISKAKLKLAYDTAAASGNIDSFVDSLGDEAAYAGLSRQQLFKLSVQMIATGSTGISLEEQVSEINRLASAAGYASINMINLKQAMHGGMSYEDFINSYLSGLGDSDALFDFSGGGGGGGGDAKTKAQEIKEAFDDTYDDISHKIKLLEYQYDELKSKGKTGEADANLQKQVAYYEEAAAKAHEAAESVREYYRAQGMLDEDIELTDEIKELSEAWWEAANAAKEAKKTMFEDGWDYYESYISARNDLNSWGTDNEVAALQRQMRYLEDSYANGLVDYKDYCDKKQDLTKDLYDAQKSMLEDYVDAVKKEIDSQIKALAEELDAIEKSMDGYDATVDVLGELLDKAEDGLSKENDELDRQKELMEALADLERAKNQRTIRVFREGQGFIYEQDTSAIEEAQKKYDDLKKDIEDDSAKKRLEELREAIEGITGSYSKNKNKALADAVLGAGWEGTWEELVSAALGGGTAGEEAMATLLAAISDYTEKYSSLAADADEDIEGSVASQIKHLEDLSDEWDDWLDSVTSANVSYTNLLSQVSDFESQNYQQRLQNLAGFVDASALQMTKLSGMTTSLTGVPTSVGGIMSGAGGGVSTGVGSSELWAKYMSLRGVTREDGRDALRTFQSVITEYADSLNDWFSEGSFGGDRDINRYNGNYEAQLAYLAERMNHLDEFYSGVDFSDSTDWKYYEWGELEYWLKQYQQLLEHNSLSTEDYNSLATVLSKLTGVWAEGGMSGFDVDASAVGENAWYNHANELTMLDRIALEYANVVPKYLSQEMLREWAGIYQDVEYNAEGRLSKYGISKDDSQYNEALSAFMNMDRMFGVKDQQAIENAITHALRSNKDILDPSNYSDSYRGEEVIKYLETIFGSAENTQERDYQALADALYDGSVFASEQSQREALAKAFGLDYDGSEDYAALIGSVVSRDEMLRLAALREQKIRSEGIDTDADGFKSTADLMREWDIAHGYYEDAADTFVSVYDKFSAAVSEYSENGRLSAETIDELNAKYPELVESMYDVDGALTEIGENALVSAERLAGLGASLGLLGSTPEEIADELYDSWDDSVDYNRGTDYSALMKNASSYEEMREYAAQRDAKIAGEGIDVDKSGYKSTDELIKEWEKEHGYANGGVVDYTGMAVLHGGKGAEVVLSNKDVAKVFDLIHNGPSLVGSYMTDIMNTVRLPSFDSVGQRGGNTELSIGDIHLSGVNDVNSLAAAIRDKLPNAVLQYMYKR